MAIGISKKAQRNYHDSLVSRGMAPWDARNKMARKIAGLALSIMASAKLYQSQRFEKCKAGSGKWDRRIRFAMQREGRRQACERSTSMITPASSRCWRVQIVGGRPERDQWEWLPRHHKDAVEYKVSNIPMQIPWIYNSRDQMFFKPTEAQIDA